MKSGSLQKVVLRLSVITILCSCRFSVDVGNSGCEKALKKYFDTDNINIEKSDKLFSLMINHSKLADQELLKKGYHWTKMEAFASIGALIIVEKYRPLDQDSIMVTMRRGTTVESYKYSTADLKFAEECISVAQRFCKLIGDKNYHEAKTLLGDSVFKALSGKSADSVLTATFSSKPVTKVSIVACKMSDDVATLYMTNYYSEKDFVTFVFGFYLHKDKKIVGISTLS